MRGFISRLVLLCICLWLLLQHNTDVSAVISLLIAIATLALCGPVENKKLRTALIIVYVAASFFLTPLIFFIPALFYDCYINRFHWGYLGIVPCIFFLHNADDPLVFIPWFLIAVISVLLAYLSDKLTGMENAYISQRDSSTEINMALRDKNKALIENQNYEIRVATLGERNRIAREIHDNVGHMLSRSILQMGALMAVYKEEPLHTQLSSVNETLNQAMTSIRESVHGLRDDSLDLKQMISETLTPMQADYNIHYQYDMSDNVNKDVKYCFAAVVKEALSNIVKHSDANKIDVIVREQPAFYQLSIEDNGKTKKASDNEGMGLQNMSDRVSSLNGIIHINKENGFKIFISIPKKINPEKI